MTHTGGAGGFSHTVRLELRAVTGRKFRLAALFLSAFVVAQIFVALFLESYQSLVWFSVYTAVSNFAIPWLPHEPMVLLYGTLYTPLLVAVVGGLATCWMEFFNYRLLEVLTDLRWARSVVDTQGYRTAERYFGKLPFLALVSSGATPVPFAPFRVLAVTTGYPLGRYLLSVFVGRTPRYYLLALTGKIVSAPYWAYILVFLALVAVLIWSRLMTLRGTARAR